MSRVCESCGHALPLHLPTCQVLRRGSDYEGAPGALEPGSVTPDMTDAELVALSRAYRKEHRAEMTYGAHAIMGDLADALERWVTRKSSSGFFGSHCCPECHKLTRNTTAGCDHCDMEHK